MDALKFLTEQRRMCRANKNECDTCPTYIGKGDCYLMFIDGNDDDFFVFREAIKIVEKWSEAHPIKTNGDAVKELYHNHIALNNEDDNFVIFDRNWWNAEYKEG